MPKTLKTSTAIFLALSLAQPLPLAAQEALPEGAICADGAEPPCAEGVELILPEDAAEPAPEAAAQAEEPAPEEAAPAEAPAPAEEAAAEEASPAEEAPAKEIAVDEPVAEEPARVEEPAAEEAAAPEEAAPAAEAPAEEPAPAEAAPSAEKPAAAEPAPEVAAPAEAPAAGAPAPVEEAPAEAAGAQDESVAEQPAATEAAPEAGPADGAPAQTREVLPPVEAPLVIPGAEERLEEARQVIELLGVSADPAAGEGGAAAAAAAAEDTAEAEATVETEVTEADSRQSNEEFATTASGAVRAGAGDGGGLSNFEKAALVGLGILAVGAILSNGDEVVANTGDRVVMRRGGDDYYVLKDDDALLRQPGSTVRTETFNDGSTRTTVTRDDGSRIITIRDASGRVLRRVREDADGRQVLLIDDIEAYEPVVVEQLPEPASGEVSLDETDPLALRLALERAARDPGRSFSLRQVREIERVRKLVPEIAFDPVTFASGSAAIEPSEAEELLRLGDLMVALIEDNPGEVFLIEGHTDAVGQGAFNLALSDRRAESVALALTEYFGVPPENMVVQGYGESDLKIDTLEDERRNRRVTVRRITPLLDQRMARN